MDKRNCTMCCINLNHCLGEYRPLVTHEQGR